MPKHESWLGVQSSNSNQIFSFNIQIVHLKTENIFYTFHTRSPLLGAKKNPRQKSHFNSLYILTVYNTDLIRHTVNGTFIECSKCSLFGYTEEKTALANHLLPLQKCI